MTAPSRILSTCIVCISLGLFVLPARFNEASHEVRSRSTNTIVYHHPQDDFWNTISGKAPITKGAASQPDADQLKSTTWYAEVVGEISRKSYFIVPAEGDRAASVNLQQGTRSDYDASGFTLSPLDDPNAVLTNRSEGKQTSHWKLRLQLKGLYADNKLICRPDACTAAISDASELRYVHRGLLQVQYQNTPAGLRQNFIVGKAPCTGAKELRVSLNAGKGWIVDKVNDRELHFARHTASGVADTKVIYNDLNVWDATGKKLEATMQQGKDNSFDLVVAAADATYPVTIDPLASTPGNTLNGSTQSRFGASVASAGDVNGDGYGDVIVGAFAVNIFTGAAYIFHGSSSGLSSTAATTLTGSATSASFGQCVAGAGDVNGDGYSDVIVGAYQNGPAAGQAKVYLGSASGISTSANATINGSGPNCYLGYSLSGAGDVNGDGYSDVIVGEYGAGSTAGAAYVYLGSATGIGGTAATTLTGTATNHFGWNVGGIGDVNGDGYSDVAVGAIGYSSFIGITYVYHGSSAGIATSPTLSINAPAGVVNFGELVTSAGDVNGDGYGDFIASANDHAFIYHGSPTGLTSTPATSLTGTSTSFFGVSGGSVGDINGDGYGDIILGAYASFSNAGAAYLYQGSASGLSGTSALTLFGSGQNDVFGISAGCAGDINGDGYSDVIVGASGANSAGAAYVYYSNTGGVSPVFNTRVANTVANGAYGSRVAGAGDVNGDGYEDVVVGASGIGSNTGAVYVYHGSDTGLSVQSADTLLGTANSFFGASVAGAGDVNGDGYADVIVGAYTAAAGFGRAYVYLGSPGGTTTTPLVTLTGPAAGSFFGISVSGAGDVNNDGYYDVIVGADGVSSQGAAYLYYGSATGLLTATPVTLNGTANSLFGISVARAGDVNGDGYGDVIVGASGSSSGAGAVYIYHGSSSGLATSPAITLSGTSGNNLGYSVSAAGDVNGDGYGDVVVGAPGVQFSTGAAYIFHGGVSGISSPAATTMNNPGFTAEFGTSVGGVGDVNGDGYSDVVIGAPSGSGTSYVYHGSTNGLVTTPAATLTCPPGTGQFGICVGGAGDVNGDGYSDAVIGSLSTVNNTGSMFIYAGNNGYNRRVNTMNLYGANLTTRLNQTNQTATSFGVGVFVRPATGATRARLVWETEPAGTGFLHNSPITNYAGFTGSQGSYTTIPPAGIELKALVAKNGNATKFRVRVQYLATVLPGGQKFGRWLYPQASLNGIRPAILYSPAVLPLRLLSFTARNEFGTSNVLEWQTTSGEATDVFEVMRSTDGTSFERMGEVVGKAGNGTYSYRDQIPFAPVAYYRLTIRDLSGRISYSNIVMVRISTTGQSIVVSPIPASTRVTITSTDPAMNGKDAVITNMQGKLVYRFQVVPVTVLDVHRWASGIYLLQLPDGSVMKMVRE